MNRTRKVQDKIVKRKLDYVLMYRPNDIQIPEHMELSERYYGRVYTTKDNKNA